MSGTLSNIYGSISYALYLHTKEITRLQEQVSTGARINRVSDDPTDAYRVLGLNSQANSLENYINNLSETISTLEITSSVLGSITSELAAIKTQLTQITSGTYSENNRQIIAEGIDSTLEQIVSLANTKHENRYIFGGSNTDKAPFTVERTNGKITAVTYQGGNEQRYVEVAPGLQSSAFYVGERIFCSNNRSDPIFQGDTGAKAGTGTSSVCGDVWLTVINDGSNYKLSIDDGASYVTVPVGGNTNQAVTNSRTGQVLYVDSTEIDSTGVELVSVPGTYNVFETLINIRDLLQNDRGFSEDKLRELINSSLSSLDEVYNLLVQAGISVNSRTGFLSDLQDNLQNIKYNTEDEVTQLEEADIAQIAIDLSRRELLYEMSLSLTARLMSMSLLDFID